MYYKMSDGFTKSISKGITYSRAYSLVLVSVSSLNMGYVIRFEGHLGSYILDKIGKSGYMSRFMCDKYICLSLSEKLESEVTNLGDFVEMYNITRGILPKISLDIDRFLFNIFGNTVSIVVDSYGNLWMPKITDLKTRLVLLDISEVWVSLLKNVKVPD